MKKIVSGQGVSDWGSIADQGPATQKLSPARERVSAIIFVHWLAANGTTANVPPWINEAAKEVILYAASAPSTIGEDADRIRRGDE